MIASPVKLLQQKKKKRERGARGVNGAKSNGEEKKKRGHILVRLNRNDITGVQTSGTKRKRGIVCVRRRGPSEDRGGEGARRG